VDYDLIVVGGGPVGASLARAAGGASVALLAPARRIPKPAPEDSFDSRVYALSPGNVSFLREIGAWQAIPEARLAPVHAMRVFGDDGAARIEFDAYRAGVPELAWIVEDAALQDALWQGLDAMAPAEPETLEVSEKRVRVTLRDGRSLEARLVVGADGANSFVRRAAGIAAAEREYGQTAVVANFRCEKPHRNTAHQWFQRGPVLALLPLPAGQVSMVWSLPTAEAERVLRLDPETLCRELEAASRGALGALALAATPRSYPLRHLAARRMVAPRVALAGDAGHVIHPLAGQGLNLGLQDVRELASVLARRDEGRDPGDLRLLRRYERARAEPILAMNIAVDGLFTLFGGKSEGVARLRNAGLNLADRVPVLKNVLIRQAMS
jgi:ubiquinone biosynthesis UbiH/UbiF/VisC/COQ6 family hydroxylase